MTKEYHRRDLIEAIDEMYGSNYAAKSGALSGVLKSVLITVDVWEPELFKRIMETEMAVQEIIKGEQNDD